MMEPPWWAEMSAVAWESIAWGAATLVAAALVGWALARILARVLGAWSRRTTTLLDDSVLRHLQRPMSWLLPLVFVLLALPLTALEGAALNGVRQFLAVAVTLCSGWAVFGVVKVVEDAVNRRFDIASGDNLAARTVRTQMQGFRNIAGFAIGVVTLGIALLSFSTVRELGAGLLASAGVAGIVLGFAAQRSISTVIAGLQIAIAQPIRVDDVVIVEGEWGRIEEITLTYVVVRIWDLRRLIVPINYFIETPFQNWTRTSSDILGTVFLHVDYRVDVDDLREELKRILDASPHWDKKVWGLQVTDSTERSIVLRPLMSASDASAAWNLRCEVREKLIRYVRERHPEALPRLRADVSDATGPSSSARAKPAGERSLHTT